jgi:hypothetical protein
VPGGFEAILAPTAVVFQGNLWVFARSASSSDIYRNIFDGVFWSGWGKVPIPSAREPIETEATVYGGILRLFVRDVYQSDGRIFEIGYSGSSWSGYQEVPGSGLTHKGPTTAVYKQRLWLFVAGLDNFLYRNIRNGTGWTGWSALPGVATTGVEPGAVTYAKKLWLFIRTDSGEIYRRKYGTSWSTWAQVPGGATPSGPSATKHGNRLWLLVRGTDDGIHYNRF